MLDPGNTIDSQAPSKRKKIRKKSKLETPFYDMMCMANVRIDVFNRTFDKPKKFHWNMDLLAENS